MGVIFYLWQIVGHYPVAGWLRLACSYVKRRASGVDWEDKVDCKTLEVIQEILVDEEKKDSVTRAWHIAETKIGVVWCDASSIAKGVVVEIGGLVAEDVTWLRKGINLAIKWGLREIEIRTYSSTVLS